MPTRLVGVWKGTCHFVGARWRKKTSMIKPFISLSSLEFYHWILSRKWQKANADPSCRVEDSPAHWKVIHLHTGSQTHLRTGSRLTRTGSRLTCAQDSSQGRNQPLGFLIRGTGGGEVAFPILREPWNWFKHLRSARGDSTSFLREVLL